ncbi:MAG: ABC-F family ATP-binding cassette domain-containing protein [Dehalococcoidia bacterium]
MELIRLQNVSLGYGHGPVLRDVTFRVLAGSKCGLIGPNGAGKTSILRLLTGEASPDAGRITRGPHLRTGYVPQHVAFDESQTVQEIVLADNMRAREELRRHEGLLASAAGDGVTSASDAYERAREDYERTGGDLLEQRAVEMLDALGLAGRRDHRVAALSGGERNVLSLAQALLGDPDILLLDEPGNHLDFAGIAWLEGFLRGFRGAVLIVSHNRYLLDRAASTILHLENGEVKTYAGNYSAYRAAVLREKIAQQADYVVNQKRLAQLEEQVKRFEEFARRTGDPKWGRRLRARRSLLEREREDAVEKPAAEMSAINVAFTAEATRADVALQVRRYAKAFGERALFDNASLDVAVGERVALVGPNGCGKTTFVRDLVEYGAWDDATIRVGPSLRVGYCAQQQEVLDDNRTVLEELISTGAITRDRAFGVLSQFLFRTKDLAKRVGDLSGGERNRLQLAKLMTLQPDFLVLDEPTNHLDIPACEAIEEALANFNGTLLVVSHDRYFLDKIVGRVIEVRDGGFESYEGNFSEYWQERHPQTLPASRGRIATRRRERERAPRDDAVRRETPQQAELRQRIEAMERGRHDLERQVADAFTRGDHKEGTRSATRLEQHKARLDKLYAQWIEVEDAAR